MTPKEFKEDVLPVLAGRWKGMVRTPGKNADSFAYKAADEANMHIWDSLSEFPAKDVIEQARETSNHIPCLPEGKNYHWLVRQIRGGLIAKRNAAQGDRWNWSDECTMWHIMADYARRGKQCDEVDIARNQIGKNPCVEEQEAAYTVLCKHVDGCRERAVKRGQCTEHESVDMYPYPREALEQIKHNREEWLATRQVMIDCQGTLSEIAGLLE